jgi:photosynthetic reaction center cytochrome c subunit
MDVSRQTRAISDLRSISARMSPMRITRTIRKLWAPLALVLAVASLATAQQPTAQQPPAAAVPADREGKKAEEVYKNIQVLQGTPAEDLIQVMHVIKGDLGVECEYCHVSTTPGMGAEKDDLEPKQTARKMMKMVMDINKTQFGGAPLVTCYTCHRGSPVPLATPVLPIVFTPEKPAPDPPTVDQILSKYIQALGGEQAIRKVTSRMITATEDLATGKGGSVPTPARVEIYSKAPNLSVIVYHTAQYTISSGFDGSRSWTQDLTGRVTTPLKLDADRAKRDADFFDCLNLKKKYTDLSVTGIETVNHREAYVLTGTPADDSPEELYFDKQTGLLLRKATIVPTALGDSPMEINYDDYRDTGSGVKVPFLIRLYPFSQRTELQANSTIRVLKVQDNLPIAGSKFVRPQSRVQPPPAAAASPAPAAPSSPK